MLKQIKIDILFSGLAFRIDARQTLCPSDRYGPSVLSLPCAGAARLLWAPPVHEATGGYAVRRAQGLPMLQETDKGGAGFGGWNFS